MDNPFLHSDISQMETGSYWYIDVPNTTSYIVFWNKEKKYFTLCGDKRQFRATHIAKGVIFAGPVIPGETLILEATKLYKEIYNKEDKPTLIILPRGRE